MKEILNSRISLIVVLLFSISCTSDNSQNGGDKAPIFVEFLKKERFVVSATGKVSGVGLFYQPYGSSNIYILDEASSSVFRLDVIDETIEQHVQLAIDNVEYFSVNENENSTVVVSPDSVHVFFNDSAEKSTLALGRINKNAFTTVLSQGFVPLISNNKIFLHHFPDIPKTYKSEVFYSQSVEVAYDLSSGTYDTIAEALYPEIYRQYSFGYIFSPYRNMFDDQRLVYTFPNDDSAYVLSVDDNSVVSHEFGVRTEYEQVGVDISEAVFADDKVYEDIFARNAFYVFPTFAPRAGHYLRAMLVQKDSTEVMRPVVYSVYDSNFNYIGESKPMENGLGVLIDSDEGLMCVEFDNDSLYVFDLTWEASATQ